MEGDEVTRIRSCGHVFHTQSIRNWFSNRVRCPVCRYDIREYNRPVQTDVSNNVPTRTSGSATVNIEQSLDGLTENISNLIANYFANNNADLSSNQTIHFDIPIVATYEVNDDADTDEGMDEEDDNSDE